MKKPKVTCIVTSYNKIEFLPDALDSVLAQDFTDFECLVIDDNSTDGCWEEIQRYEKLDKRIIPLKTDLDPSNHDITCNRYNHNVNRALKFAEGQFITYLCDDDWFFPTRFSRMVNYLERPDSSGITICYGIQLKAHQENGELTMGEPRRAPKVLMDARLVVDHSSVMHRVELLQMLGEPPWWPEGVETWRMGDAAFWGKLCDFGIPFFRIPGTEPTDVHRYNRLSVSFKIDNPEPGPNFVEEGHDYTQRDDLGNHRTINSGVDPGWSSIG